MDAQIGTNYCPYILLIPVFGYPPAVTYIRLLIMGQDFFFGIINSRFPSYFAIIVGKSKCDA